MGSGSGRGTGRPNHERAREGTRPWSTLGVVMRKHIGKGITAVAVLTLVLFLLPGQASASHTVCNDNEFCDWKHTGFNIGDPNNLCWNTDHNDIDNYGSFSWVNCTTGGLADNLNDDTSSARNEFNSTTIKLCRNANGGTPCTSFPANTELANLSGSSVGNDQASSHNP